LAEVARPGPDGQVFPVGIRLLQVALAIVVTASAVVSGLSADSGDKMLIVLPLATVLGLGLGVLAFTRFAGFVLLLLGVRASIDALAFSASSAGSTTGSTTLNSAINPSALFGVLFLLASILWLAMRYHSTGLLKGSRATFWLVAFWLAAVLSLAGSQHIAEGATESLRIMAVIMMFVVLEQLIVDRQMLNRTLLAAYASMLIPLGYTLYGLAIGHPATEDKSGFLRLVGTFSQSNSYGRYLTFMIVFGVAIYPHLKGASAIAMRVLLVIASIFLIQTLTLTAIIAAVIGLIVVGVVARRGTLLVGFVVVAVLAILLSPGLASRFGTVQTQTADGSPSGNTLAWRFGYWADVLPLANRNPVTGIGVGATSSETDAAKQPHNDFLRAYVETGVIGLLLYIGMLGSLVGICRRALRRSRGGTFEHAVATGALACVVACIVESAASNVITNSVALWYLMAFVAAAGYIARSPRSQGPEPAAHILPEPSREENALQLNRLGRETSSPARGGAGAAGPPPPGLGEPEIAGPPHHQRQVSSERPRAGNEAVAKMARGSGLNLIGAICSQSSLFLITTVLALKLGRADVGRYAESYALLSLLGLLSLAGLRNGLTRFIAMFLVDNDSARVRGTVRLGLGLTLIATTCIAGCLALTAPLIADLFHDPALRPALLIVALTLPASAFEDAALAATQGWRSQKAFALIGLIFDPVLRLLLTVAALSAGAGLNGALWALAAASWTGAALAGLTLRKRLRTVPPATPIMDTRRIISYSSVSWFSALASTGLVWADVLLLGALSTQENVGTYTIATRLVTLAVFVMAPINAAFTPHIAHFSHLGDTQQMSRAYGSANRWIMRLSMPAFITLLIFPHDLLGFFGREFVTDAAASVTILLAMGQMVSAAAGPCGSVLNMSGRVGLSALDNVGALVLNISLNLWLIPLYGIVGAAVAWSLSLTVVNTVKALQVRTILGVRSAGADWAKTFMAAAPAAAVGMLVASLTSGWLAATALGFGSVALVFIAGLTVLGIGFDDAAMVRAALGRFGHGTSVAGRQGGSGAAGGGDRAQRVDDRRMSPAVASRFVGQVMMVVMVGAVVLAILATGLLSALNLFSSPDEPAARPGVAAVDQRDPSTWPLPPSRLEPDQRGVQSETIKLNPVSASAAGQDVVHVTGRCQPSETKDSLYLQVQQSHGWITFPWPAVTDCSGSFTALVELGGAQARRVRVLDIGTGEVSNATVVSAG
jgi:O-antigen/teichoic acid export membrane protein/O-antigen ligase